MKVTIKPSFIFGEIQAPVSKSSMQRACAAALLHEGVTVIKNQGNSYDDLAALDVIRRLGANSLFNEIDNPKNRVVRSEGINPISSEMYCGESGLGIRMFTPLAALSNLEMEIKGGGSLLTRPMNFFDEIFPQLDVSIKSNEGKLPLVIKGPLQPKDITVDGSLSSQFLTGLLFAFGKAAKKTVTITVTNLKSKPYIDLTLHVMKHFGYSVINNNYESFTINPTEKKIPGRIEYTVEGDWSGGAFLLVAGAIAGKIIVNGLDVSSTQADKKILEALKDCGCILSIQENKIEVSNSPLGIKGLKPFHFDATDCPDLFPPLVALAAYCDGISVIEGVERLSHKESDRGLTLQEEFAKMGVEIVLQGNLMLIHGGKGVQGAEVHSRHDHRIAMACAVAALKANGDTTIEDAEAINKSYPSFYEDLKKLNAIIINNS